ncbi:hypothetical protein Jiend_14240 [Micromonospora endophytica]|nr:hypothetical protein Jiend_14240 [Micromonospora endophytica]
MPRHRHLGTATLALGLVVLTDVLRVFLPSVITIFGQAASTPAELLGAFALGWFVLALAAPALLRWLGAGPVGLASAVVLGAARLALTAAPGGRTQLWLATAGLLAGLVWLAATAARVTRAVPGLAFGLTAGGLGHALFGTYDLVWWQQWEAWAVSVGLVALLLLAEVAGVRGTGEVQPAGVAGAAGVQPAGVAGAAGVQPAGVAGAGGAGPGGQTWLLAGPALLLAGMLALSPAVAGTAMSFWSGSAGTAGPPLFALAPLSLAAALFLIGALTPPARRWRPLPPALLLVGTVLFGYGSPTLLAVAMVLTAAGLGGCLALAEEAPTTVGACGRAATRRAYAAVGGMVAFAVATVLYYAAYDIGYPNGAIPVLVAVLVGLIALGRFRTAPVPSPEAVATISTEVRLVSATMAAVVALAAAWAHGPWLVASNREGPPAQVRLVAYNIRMGFGMDGRFDLAALEAAIGRADVVVLSEVDRGWLLNGGHDTLHLLADRLQMPYVFAPAAGALWGDAVLSHWPVRQARTRPLPAVGAPTGAQALGVTVDFSEGVRLAVVSTHLQPPPGADPVVQARAVAEFATGYADGAPLVVAGDFNTEPGDAAFTTFAGAGLRDALASARPLPTSPADDPRAQIDHIFVSPELTATDPVAVPSTASDHLPVAVTLTLPTN